MPIHAAAYRPTQAIRELKRTVFRRLALPHQPKRPSLQNCADIRQLGSPYHRRTLFQATAKESHEYLL